MNLLDVDRSQSC